VRVNSMPTYLIKRSLKHPLSRPRLLHLRNNMAAVKNVRSIWSDEVVREKKEKEIPKGVDLSSPSRIIPHPVVRTFEGHTS